MRKKLLIENLLALMNELGSLLKIVRLDIGWQYSNDYQNNVSIITGSTYVESINV